MILEAVLLWKEMITCFSTHKGAENVEEPDGAVYRRCGASVAVFQQAGCSSVFQCSIVKKRTVELLCYKVCFGDYINYIVYLSSEIPTNLCDANAYNFMDL